MEGESLSEILDGSSAFTPRSEPVEAEATDDKPAVEPEPAAPSAVEPKPPVEEKAEASRDEKGRFAKKEEKPEPMVPLSALLAERAKRKEPETPKPKVSVFENEDQAFQQRVEEQVTPLKQSLFQMSVEFARTRYDDFDEVAGIFAQAADSDDRLWQQMRDHHNPAMYVYQVGKQFKELAPYGGDVVRYRDASVAETREALSKAQEQITALTAEIEALKKSQTELESVPRSLNKTGSGTAPKATDADPEDIKSIVRFGGRSG